MMSSDEVRVEVEKEATGKPILLEAAKLLEDAEVVTSIESTISRDTVDDPWVIVETQEPFTRWSDLSWRGRLYRVLVQGVGKLSALLFLLYLFVCSLDLLSSSFRLLGGRAAGAAFSNSELLQNPVAGLMIGVMATVLVQSSSTSTSITVTMVASGILSVRPAIPIIMGANIGTSVTNTIVSLAQSSNKNEFRRAFGGATVHDMFNWITVFTLLPLEILTGYLYHLTSAIVSGINLDSAERLAAGEAANKDLLKTITKPFTDLVVKLDKRVIEGIAVNDPEYMNQRLMKVWCSYEEVERGMNVTELINSTDQHYLLNSTADPTNLTLLSNITSLQNVTVLLPLGKCPTLFSHIDIGDVASGALLLIFSLALLCSCLVLLVRLLNSALHGSVIRLVRRVVNAGSDAAWSGYLAGYLAMLVGAVMTMIVQSSSVFTSALTPLVGVGVVKLERMYPLTLGSNVGTTTTGLLAAMAADAARLKPALQIALVHLFFNLTGILLFYPVPWTRVPIKLAKIMGDTTARYRWFALFYVLLMFFLLPLLVFSLSLIHPSLMLSVILSTLFVFFLVIIINLLQRRKPSLLPKQLRDWTFLPLPLRSLDPLDRRITSLVKFLHRCSCCRCVRHIASHEEEEERSEKEEEKCVELLTINAESQDSSHDTCDDADDLYTPTVVRYRDCESGYVSRTTTPRNTPANTPSATPCISRLPSCAVIHEELSDDENEQSTGENIMSGNTEKFKNQMNGNGEQDQNHANVDTEQNNTNGNSEKIPVSGNCNHSGGNTNENSTNSNAFETSDSRGQDFMASGGQGPGNSRMEDPRANRWAEGQRELADLVTLALQTATGSGSKRLPEK